MLLKDSYNEDSVRSLSDAIEGAFPAFSRQAFTDRVFAAGWQALELKGRMRRITTALRDTLPQDYRSALQILQQALPSLIGTGFILLVLPDYIEVCGLDDWQASMPALEAFTQVVSAEFAIRPFIVRYPDRTMAQMLKWAQHEHPGVRRLASEGCRPRLPWGIALPALKLDPSPILPILELLKQDESESVRRSVANNLNDISKDNPEVVLSLVRRWQADDCLEIQRLTRHALRTLLKQGHPQALELLGYPSAPAISVRNLAVEPKTLALGGQVTLSFDVVSSGDEPQNLMIDYVVHHVRARGNRTPKVFKLTKRTIQPGQVLHISRNHSFAPVTTRKYYPGLHAIQPKINGQLFGLVEFALS
jgi:3-methyladenine DNA glycosylase AlkC